MGINRQLLRAAWKLRTILGQLLCLAGKHDWRERIGVSLEQSGDDVAGKEIRPGRFRICKRFKCRTIRGTLALHDFGKYLEVDDFLVVVRKSCGKCYGRGFIGWMQIPGGFHVKVPCGCLTVQPAYFERKIQGEAGRA